MLNNDAARFWFLQENTPALLVSDQERGVEFEARPRDGRAEPGFRGGIEMEIMAGFEKEREPGRALFDLEP